MTPDTFSGMPSELPAVQAAVPKIGRNSQVSLLSPLLALMRDHHHQNAGIKRIPISAQIVTAPGVFVALASITAPDFTVTRADAGV